MNTHFDIEDQLSRELHTIADELRVPPRPPMTTPRSTRRWHPLLVAAAVLAVVAAGVALITSSVHTATPTGPGETQASTDIPRSAPTVPYVLDHRLHVGKATVAGAWTYVQRAGDSWVGEKTNGSWWYGNGTRASRIALGKIVGAPVISANGEYVALIVRTGHHTTLTGFGTRVGGEGLGGARIPAKGSGDILLSVRLVGDDGQVIVSGGRASMLWKPLLGNQPLIDLGEKGPTQTPIAHTPVGAVLTNGANGAPYLSDLGADATSRQRDPNPAAELAVDPSGTWLAWPASETGAATAIPALEAERVRGDHVVRLDAPKGWNFAVRSWTWESDTVLVSRVVSGDGEEQMARCSATKGACVLIR